MQLPDKNQAAVYETDIGTVNVDRFTEMRGVWFGLHNITTGCGYVPRNRRDTIAWLTRHQGKFVALVNIPTD